MKRTRISLGLRKNNTTIKELTDEQDSIEIQNIMGKSGKDQQSNNEDVVQKENIRDDICHTPEPTRKRRLLSEDSPANDSDSSCCSSPQFITLTQRAIEEGFNVIWCSPKKQSTPIKTDIKKNRRVKRSLHHNHQHQHQHQRFNQLLVKYPEKKVSAHDRLIQNIIKFNSVINEAIKSSENSNRPDDKNINLIQEINTAESTSTTKHSSLDLDFVNNNSNNNKLLQHQQQCQHGIKNSEDALQQKSKTIRFHPQPQQQKISPVTASSDLFDCNDDSLLLRCTQEIEEKIETNYCDIDFADDSVDQILCTIELDKIISSSQPSVVKETNSEIRNTSFSRYNSMPATSTITSNQNNQKANNRFQRYTSMSRTEDKPAVNKCTVEEIERKRQIALNRLKMNGKYQWKSSR